MTLAGKCGRGGGDTEITPVIEGYRRSRHPLNGLIGQIIGLMVDELNA
jgi:hypothetical protein